MPDSSHLSLLLGRGEEGRQNRAGLGHPMPGSHVPAQSPRRTQLSRLLLLDSIITSVVLTPQLPRPGMPRDKHGTPVHSRKFLNSDISVPESTQAQRLAEPLDSPVEGLLGEGECAQEGGATPEHQLGRSQQCPWREPARMLCPPGPWMGPTGLA